MFCSVRHSLLSLLKSHSVVCRKSRPIDQQSTDCAVVSIGAGYIGVGSKRTGSRVCGLYSNEESPRTSIVAADIAGYGFHGLLSFLLAYSTSLVYHLSKRQTMRRGFLWDVSIWDKQVRYKIEIGDRGDM